ASRAQGAAAARQSARCDDRERSLLGRIRRAVRVLSHGAQSGDRAVHGTEIRRARDFENNGKVSWSPPNITADAQTGRLGKLTEDEFVARFRAGRTLPDSPMPWQGFSKMDEDDLRAIYRYLKSVPPVTNDVGP